MMLTMLKQSIRGCIIIIIIMTEDDLLLQLQNTEADIKEISESFEFMYCKHRVYKM